MQMGYLVFPAFYYGPLTLTDHITTMNSCIAWDNSKILSWDSQNRSQRWIKEAIHILKESWHTLNRDMEKTGIQWDEVPSAKGPW